MGADVENATDISLFIERRGSLKMTVILILILIVILSLLTALVSTRLAALLFLRERAGRTGVELVMNTSGNTKRT